MNHKELRWRQIIQAAVHDGVVEAVLLLLGQKRQAVAQSDDSMEALAKAMTLAAGGEVF